jgi:hypothetical protein
MRLRQIRSDAPCLCRAPPPPPSGGRRVECAGACWQRRPNHMKRKSSESDLLSVRSLCVNHLPAVWLATTRARAAESKLAGLEGTNDVRTQDGPPHFVQRQPGPGLSWPRSPKAARTCRRGIPASRSGAESERRSDPADEMQPPVGLVRLPISHTSVAQTTDCRGDCQNGMRSLLILPSYSSFGLVDLAGARLRKLPPRPLSVRAPRWLWGAAGFVDTRVRVDTIEQAQGPGDRF